MDSISLMVEEHRYIKRMLGVIRKMCHRILKDEPVDYPDFFTVMDFVRNYADQHHHGKEEALLFDRMMKELGSTAEKLVKLGMYVEHDLGRLHIQELEAAVQLVMEGNEEARLDVIANAVSYTHLLHRHIDKEDTVVFMYAKNNLSQETLQELDEASDDFEQRAADQQTQERYITLLEGLERKYSGEADGSAALDD